MMAWETDKGAGRSKTQHKDTKAHRCNIKFLEKVHKPQSTLASGEVRR